MLLFFRSSAYLSVDHSFLMRAKRFLLFSSFDKNFWKFLGTCIEEPEIFIGSDFPRRRRSWAFIDISFYESVTKCTTETLGRRLKRYLANSSKVSGIVCKEWSKTFPSKTCTSSFKI